jgi:inhibitor of KinA sporulation pathway (predicted exonuclease)
LWCKGTDFDVPILNNVCKQYGIIPTWKYSAVRDFRTAKKLFPHIEADPFVGAPHNALDDAINQALHLRKILGTING